MGPALSGAAAAAAAAYGLGWELRRRAYAAGLLRPARVPARVVSIGNLTAGGTGKTTLVLHLAAAARARGLAAAVVCRRYRPGPGGEGDEERLLRAAGARVHAGANKRRLAAAAARAGAALVLVDDGFSHWRLARDLDVVLLDHGDPWGGGRLLPAGRLREPVAALQRARVVVLTRCPAHADPAPLLAEIGRRAPGALLAAARHEVTGVRTLAGATLAARGPARVVTATGNPEAVAASAREAGFAPVTLAAYRDHHWFTAAEARRERAAAAGAALLLTAKDAVRWPAAAGADGVAVLEVAWRWRAGGERVERLVFEGED